MRFIIFAFLCVHLTYAQEKTSISIYFPNDSYEITTVALQRIDSLKKRHLNDSLSIQLKGFSNGYASAQYNMRLAEQRMASVATQLNPLHIKDQEAVGELDDYSGESRRVDIETIITEINIPDSTQYQKAEPLSEGNKRRMLSSRRLDIRSYSDLKINEKTVLFGIFFKGATDKMLGSGSEITLRKLVRFLNGYPTRKILLTGHICCSPYLEPSVDGANMRTGSETLSVDRAKAVYDYLLKKGIAPSRLKYEGKEYLEPLDCEEIKNRRVEITILEE
jgi:outer membrane protein OmpA-like peptidoglycan-associated protein